MISLLLVLGLLLVPMKKGLAVNEQQMNKYRANKAAENVGIVFGGLIAVGAMFLLRIYYAEAWRVNSVFKSIRRNEM
jgi:hypothetical protein